MDGRNTEDYEAVFEYFKKTVKELRPLRSMSDYESAMRKALKSVYPRIQIGGCYFHHNQVVNFQN